MRALTERQDDSAPRPVPSAELGDRRQKTTEKLAGMDLTGQLKCSNILVEQLMAMAEEDVLKYVPWHECTTREQEVQRLKVPRTKLFQEDDKGYLQTVARPSSLVADTSRT